MPVENGERNIAGLTWDDIARWVAEQAESNDNLRTENEMLRDTVSRSSGEILRLRAELSGEIARRTLGGTAPGYQVPGAWANRAQPPPSANDKNAPPLKRGLS
jgi:hypothetical protein